MTAEKPSEGACKAAVLTYDAEHLSRTQAAEIIDREAVAPAVRDYVECLEWARDQIAASYIQDHINEFLASRGHLIEGEGE